MWWKITLFDGVYTHVKAYSITNALLQMGEMRNEIRSIEFDQEFTDKMENS